MAGRRPPRSGARSKAYEVLAEEGEAGYLVATVKGLPRAHTQARTVHQSKRRVARVIALCEAGRGAGVRVRARGGQRLRAGRFRGSDRVELSS